MSLSDSGKLLAFLAVVGVAYAAMFLVHHFVGGWGVAAYIAAIFIGLTWWWGRHSPFKRRKPHRWEDLELPEHED